VTLSKAEREYLKTQSLGRLATVGPNGGAQVRPVGFKLNDDDTIDIGGPNNAASQKFRNAAARPLVSFIVDDMTPDEPGAIAPGWGRGVEIRGEAELLTDVDPPLAPDFFSREVIRVRPVKVISWHIDPDVPTAASQTDHP
jgi:pyridoxamine 5'-phosphate oxidase family protein